MPDELEESAPAQVVPSAQCPPAGQELDELQAAELHLDASLKVVQVSLVAQEFRKPSCLNAELS